MENISRSNNTNKYKRCFDLVDFVVKVENKEPVILQLTDTQIIDASQARTQSRLKEDEKKYWKTDKLEDRCYSFIREIITETKPDLILITGDLVFGEFDDAGTSFSSFVNFMDSFNILWAPVFGNHDNESFKGVDWQCQQLEKAKNCLFKRRTLTGNGNYTIGIEQDEELKRVFFMLDSNGCLNPVGFGKDQIEWYTQTATSLKTEYPHIKIAFAFHIQPFIFKTAYSKYGFTNEETVLHPINIDIHPNKADEDFGYIGNNLKSVWDCDLKAYESIKKLGTDLILVGHEHCNSASVVYDGIRFQFGQKSSTYDRANYISSSGTITGSYCSSDAPIIGGTVLQLSKEDGTIKSAYIYYCKTQR